MELGESKQVECTLVFKCRDALDELVMQDHDKAMKLLREPNDRQD